MANEQFPEDDQRLYDAIFRYIVETGQLDQVPGAHLHSNDVFVMAETAHATVIVPTPTIVTGNVVGTAVASAKVTATVVHPVPEIVTPERIKRAQSRLAKLGEAAVYWVAIEKGGQWLLDHDALGFLLEVARQLRANG